MLRLVRRGTHRGKLTSARFLLRLLGDRLGRVRLLLDAWFMRARLIEAAVADGHTVIAITLRDSRPAGHLQRRPITASRTALGVRQEAPGRRGTPGDAAAVAGTWWGATAGPIAPWRPSVAPHGPRLGMSITPADIVTLRQRHGWSQPQLAQELGVSPATVARWERGEGEIPQLARLALAWLMLAGARDGKGPEVSSDREGGTLIAGS
jgi:DNA-binding XRE family transcriptional regulator